MRSDSHGVIMIAVAVSLLLWTVSLVAATYRWIDKDGNIHYGSVVPAEYADRAYDILNQAGMVIEHVENNKKPVEKEPPRKEIVKRGPMIPQDIRRHHLDNLLLVQYRSEEDIEKALEFEITQLGYDAKLIRRSYQNTKSAIRDNIRQAADQQRAGIQISEGQQIEISRLYIRLGNDRKQLSSVDTKEASIRARLAADLKRFRELRSEHAGRTEKTQPSDQSDQS